MALPQRKTTARVRSPIASNEPVVEIGKGDITDTLRIETPAKDVLSALDEIKNLWTGGKVDYVATIPLIDSHAGYFIYTPEKGEGHPDPSVSERIDFLKKIEKWYGHKELEGVYIDTVRCPEDSYDLRIAKVVVRHS